MISSKPSVFFVQKENMSVTNLWYYKVISEQKEWMFANYLHRITWKMLGGPHKICLMRLHCAENFIISEAKAKGKHRLCVTCF